MDPPPPPQASSSASTPLCAGALASLSLVLLLAAPYLAPPPPPLPHLHLRNTALEAALLSQWRASGAAQRQRLEAALAAPDPPAASSPFADVGVDLPLPGAFLSVSASESDATGQRAIALAPLLRAQRGGCTCYAAGIATDAAFEAFVAGALGCETHAFDCTLRPSELAATRARHPNVTLHPVCLGAPSAIGGDYVRERQGELRFVTVAAVRGALGHAAPPDILKVDIEGGEWGVLRSEVLEPAARAQPLPRQLMFELHTQGANTAYVAPQAVAGKGRRAVNALFLDLLAAGYRVVDKVVNPGDDRCADFVLVLEGGAEWGGGGAARAASPGARVSPWDE